MKSREGELLAGATVCARCIGAGCVPELSERRPCTTTAADGRYAFAELSRGRYRVVASARGFRPSGTAAGLDARGLATIADAPLQLDFTLAAGGALLAGVVEDVQGGPIAGAGLYVLTDGGPTGEMVAGESDQSGRFELATDPGPQLLRVVADGYVSTEQRTAAPAADLRIELVAAARIAGRASMAGGRAGGVVSVVATPRDLALAQEVSTTSTADGEFVLEGLAAGVYELVARGPGLHGRGSRPIELAIGDTQTGVQIVLAAAASVEGRVVVLPHERPCADAHVFVSGVDFRATAVSDESGSVRFEGVPQGSYDIHTSCRSAQGTAQPQRIEVHTEDLTGLDFHVLEGIALRGRVVDERGHGLAGRQLVAEPTELREASGGAARSDEHGHFELTGLSPTTYRVSLANDARVSETVALSATGSVPEVRLVQGPTGSLRVQIVGVEGGAPADRWLVHARGESGMRELALIGGSTWEASELAPGRYEVSAHDHQSSVLEAELELLANRINQLVLRAPIHQASLSGRVLDDRGAPVADAWVLAIGSRGAPRGGASRRRVLTAQDGSFSIEGLATGDSYDVEAQASEGRGTARGVKAGQHVNVVLSAQASGSSSEPAPAAAL